MGDGYANPHAATQIANGLSTTTFTYDNNGNVTQKTVEKMVNNLASRK
jgi:hypothetical protein